MRKKITKYIADIITLTRILSALMLFFFEPLGVGFFVFYTICGLSDLIDGTVARKTGSVSRKGAVLDSVADIVFFSAALFKLYPILLKVLKIEYLYCLVAVALIRMAAYIVGAVKFHRFIALHTILNKIAGAAVFCFPYFIIRFNSSTIVIIIFIITSISAIEELLCQILMRQYDPDIKTVFHL